MNTYTVTKQGICVKPTMDVFKYLQKVDFKSPDILREIDAIHAEIEEITLASKPDPEKMKIILSLKGLGSDFVKNHLPVGFISKDIFAAGFITALLLKLKP